MMMGCRVGPATLPIATVGDDYDVQLTALGGSGEGYSFSATGLPNGNELSYRGSADRRPHVGHGFAV